MQNTVLSINTKDEERIMSLRLLDDDFMKIVFDNNIQATELLLNVIFNRYDIKVIKVTSQKEIKNPSGRSVILDIYAIDQENKHYDIEIQRHNKGACSKRARFNSSLLDTKLLNKGDTIEKLPDSYVIFITENDVFKKNEPVYVFERTNIKTNELFNDGSHIIYVNGSYENDTTRIGRLMHDFRCKESDKIYNKVLKDKIKYLKETEGGYENMCKIFDEIREEGIAKGIEQGIVQGIVQGIEQGKSEMKITTAIAMIKSGQISFDLVAQCLGLTLKEVNDLAKTISA